jgi:hypothetical protein
VLGGPTQRLTASIINGCFGSVADIPEFLV